MRFIKRFLLTLVVLALLFLIVGFFLPQQQHVERSITIAAPAAAIYQHVASPRAFTQWSPWSNIDPDMVTEFSGPESGKGAAMTWKSDHPNVGSGSSTITGAVENQKLDFVLDFDGEGGGTSFFKLAPATDGTQVTWGFDADMGNNPMMRWFGLMMDKWVGTDYEKGLNSLKSLVEEN